MKIQLNALQKIIFISEIIGVNNSLLLCEAYQGQHLYFPKPESVVAALRDRDIVKEIKKGRKRNHKYRNKRYDAGKLAKEFKLSKANIYLKIKNFHKLYKSIIAQGRDVEIL